MGNRARIASLVGLVALGGAWPWSGAAPALGAQERAREVGERSASISALPASLVLSPGDSARVGVTVFDDAGRRIALPPGLELRLGDSTIVSGRLDLSRGEAVLSGSEPGRTWAVFAVGPITDTVHVRVRSDDVAGDPPVRARPTPPSRVTDLTVTRRQETEFTVAFTAAGDGSGRAAAHEIRFARSPLRWGSDQARTLDAGMCASPWVPPASGVRVECPITGLEPGALYDVQLVSWHSSPDDERVFSTLSNVASGRTLRPGEAPRDPLAAPAPRDPVTAPAPRETAPTVHETVPVRPDDSAAPPAVAVASADASASEPSRDELYPNRPPGMVRVAQFDGTRVHTSDPGWQYFWGWDDGVSVVDDRDNPLGTGKALHFAWNAGVSGVGLADLNSWGRNYRELYIMYRIKYDPNWERLGHKNFYFGTPLQNRGGKGANQYFVTHEASGTANFTQQWATPTDLAFSAPGAWAGKYGRYVDVEIHAVAESSPGAGDGAVYYWHDGVLLGSNTNFAWTDSGDVVTGFDGFHWYAVRNEANTRDSWFRVGELYIAGR